MAEVRVQDGESVEAALRRFKREVLKAGIILEVKKRRHYESKRLRKKKSKEESKRRAIYNAVRGITPKAPGSKRDRDSNPRRDRDRDSF